VRQLRQRIALWARTHAITADQTANYIAQRLLIAGTSERIFSEDAVAAIHRASRGIPRIINLICEHALILAYVEQVRLVPAPMIYAVTRDLELDPQPFVVSSIHSGFPANSTLPLEKHQGRE
jgi:type II secretory pathway predicted ATPase ExeA